MNKKQFLARIIMSVFGVSLCSVCVALFRASMFGVDPFQSFVNGLNVLIPISFGTLYMIFNVLFLIVIFILDKHYIGLSTFINIFILGYMIDFASNIINALIPDPNLFVRIVLLVVGLIILCIASAFYYTADLGVANYDAVSLIMAKKHKERFKYYRIATDLFCVLFGLFCGVTTGIGTVLTAFCMGPLIAFFRKHLSEPILKKFEK